MVYSNILQTIGKTPLVQINRLNKANSTILAKVEAFNPGGSVKDRIAFQMVSDALDSGKITKGSPKGDGSVFKPRDQTSYQKGC